MITTVCKISYGSQTVPPIVPAVQGDTGRAISFEIADFTPPAGATATYFILKPSGEAIYNSATITDNSILCELTAQSLAEAGENRMQVRVLQGEDIVTSFEVILMVRTFLGDDAIESGTEMNIFDQAVEQATEQFQENAEQIVEEVIESIPDDYTALSEEVDELNERIGDLKNDLRRKGLSEDIKVALLNCFRHTAFLDSDDDYYGILEDALYPESSLVRIEAVFNQGSFVVYENTPLNDLKAYLTVTGYNNDGTTAIITDYSLSGTLTIGTSTITVFAGGKTDTFTVTVTTSVVHLTTYSIGQDTLGAIKIYKNVNRAMSAYRYGENPYTPAAGAEDFPETYCPIPISQGSATAIITMPSNMYAGIRVLHWTGAAYTTDYGSPWLDANNSSVDVSSYNDGNYFIGVTYKVGSAGTTDMTNYDMSDVEIAFS